MRGKRSPKRKRSPLPKVLHKNLPMRPYDYTVEENAAMATAQHKEWLASLKKPTAAEFPSTPEEKSRRLQNAEDP